MHSRFGEEKREYPAKRWKDSQSKKKTGVANLEVDEKVDDVSTDGEDEFEVPKGEPSYQDYLKSLGYNLFTCGVEPEGAVNKASPGLSASSASSDEGLHEESVQDTFFHYRPRKIDCHLGG